MNLRTVFMLPGKQCIVLVRMLQSLLIMLYVFTFKHKGRRIFPGVVQENLKANDHVISSTLEPELLDICINPYAGGG